VTASASRRPVAAAGARLSVAVTVTRRGQGVYSMDGATLPVRRKTAMSDSERLEREIEEILGKIEHFPSPESRAQRARKRAVRRLGAWMSQRQAALARVMSRWSMSQLMLLAALMILGSFFFRRLSPVLMTWVLYAGIILFVSALAILVFGGGRGGRVQQRWRGRTVEYRGGTPMRVRLRRWWSGMRSRR
jgi:hypothetical protein